MTQSAHVLLSKSTEVLFWGFSLATKGAFPGTQIRRGVGSETPPIFSELVQD